jgi:hypothetical protein
LLQLKQLPTIRFVPRPLFPHIAGHFPQRSTRIALPNFSAWRFFAARDQSVVPVMRRMHEESRTFWRTRLVLASRDFRCVIRVIHLNKGGAAVDLTLRMNVLAVTAVFLFVGAILLGAF